MTIRFDGRVAIVTGAGGGLGRAYAIELALRGAQVVVNDVGCSGSGEGSAAAPADGVVAEIRAAGGTAVASHESVASREGGAAIVETALDSYGRVDILISNAGILRSARFDEIEDADLDDVIDVNLKGAFHVGRPAFRAMKRQGHGRMLFVASASGLFGHPWQAVYGASKAALLGLSNVLALEGADRGVTSNVLLPAALTRLADTIDWGFLQETSDVADMMRRLEAGADRGERRLGPEWVMPLALYLVSEGCTATHGAYSAVSGRLARVFVGATPGWQPDSLPSIEDVAAMWPRIEAREGFTEPASVYHEAVEANATPRRGTVNRKG
ncbi:short-chain dehydrogenase [Nostoc sp. 3335mG]|nr:short-chain dehydrogenase [Nostoc sp. 3335mG]